MVGQKVKHKVRLTLYEEAVVKYFKDPNSVGGGVYSVNWPNLPL